MKQSIITNDSNDAPSIWMTMTLELVFVINESYIVIYIKMNNHWSMHIVKNIISLILQSAATVYFLHMGMEWVIHATKI